MKSKIKDAVIVTMIFVSSYNCYQIGVEKIVEARSIYFE
jgi:hypothetical protein